MIARETFSQLKAGDVLLLSGKLRLVLEGPADNPDNKHINRYVTLAIRRRSWTNRPTTCRLWTDCRWTGSVVRRTLDVRRFILSELDRLQSLGWNLSQLLFNAEQELSEDRRLGRNTGPSAMWEKCLRLRVNRSKKKGKR